VGYGVIDNDHIERRGEEMDTKNTYWNENGKHQFAVDELNKLVPTSGEVLNKRKNPALEKYRKASNCYYDLYNNGLMNRAREFYGVFKIASSHYRYLPGAHRLFMEELYVAVEVKMDEIIEAAMAEQAVNLLATEEAA
jgi:hypothetical protein